ncbi:MAG: RNA polymerase factor sigma-54 [Gallionellaceae bacterium]|jgi:RNA polymerase sigma-54 factor
MKVGLQLRQSQQLTLTPQLQQAIRLLQLSTLEVNQESERLLDENPFLEREEDDPSQPYAYGDARSNNQTAGSTGSSEQSVSEREAAPNDSDWAIPTFSNASNTDDEDYGFGEVAADKPTLRDHLIWQLNMSPLEERDKQLIGLLIDALDDNAYLSQSLEEIAEFLPQELDITLDDLETALVQLQHLDEPGIGARNLSECLSLQLQAMSRKPDNETKPHILELAQKLVASHLDLLAAHDYTKLKKALHCDDAALRAVQDLIVHLKPRPGSDFEQRAADYVVPDVLVERVDGMWRARLNPEAMPRLKINQVYANILQNRGENTAQEMSGQLLEARWFIKNLQQRFDTILRVSQAIVERQHQFFQHGKIAMRPLVLREIAEQLELHESTISRVTTQKFMLTPSGIYELKYFFGSGLATKTGGSCSSTAIREIIKRLVEEEDAQNPLNDSRMSEILAQQGIIVARRTVAKYRELLHILPVNLRKSI